MNKEQKQNILNLSSLIFEDKEFKFIQSCVEQDKFNKLRIFFADELEIREITSQLSPDDNELCDEIQICNTLEDVVIQHCIGISNG